ncbi:unnamed protein product [Lymnaea stagnalis]|uniref:Uncharacterized protein n=1 Tax=Lymnaea stagnalis TaxID=6523 RepID=A0AAV2HCP8_LYMST
MELLRLLTVFFIGGCHVVLSLDEFGDPCNILTWSNLSGDTDQVVNVTVPKNCLSGEIDWNYPKGSLLLKQTAIGGSFSLCVESSWSTNLSGVKDVTGGANKILPLPTEGKPSCTLSSDGVAKLILTAPTLQLYMTLVGYRITPTTQ